MLTLQQLFTKEFKTAFESEHIMSSFSFLTYPICEEQDPLEGLCKGFYIHT